MPPPVAGIGLMVFLILLGRLFFQDSISSLTSWTAYFLFATFVGMLGTGVLERFSLGQSNVRIADFAVIVTGLTCSLLALVLIEFKDLASSLLTFSVCMLFGSFLLLASRRPTKNELVGCLPADAAWSTSLDKLLKLDLPQSLRTAIAKLLDEVWQSPVDAPNFIPHQNQEIESLLDRLHLDIQQNKLSDAQDQASAIHRKLNERNALLFRHIEIEYENLSTSRLPLKRPLD